MSYGAIGFVDDYKKVIQKNPKGISSRQKLFFQTLFAAVASYLLFKMNEPSTMLTFPIFKDWQIDLGLLWIPFATFVIVGASNAVNLTDGLDGLAVGPTMTTASTFLILAYCAGHSRISEYLQIPHIPGAAELSIVLTNDDEQQVLNRDWRGIDKTTNVLSFPQIEPFGAVAGILGDIILARETLEREALVEGVSFEDHFTHLVVHGFLHILGYDHMDEDEALAMEGLETQILASLGVADPYAETD